MIGLLLIPLSLALVSQSAFAEYCQCQCQYNSSQKNYEGWLVCDGKNTTRVTTEPSYLQCQSYIMQSSMCKPHDEAEQE